MRPPMKICCQFLLRLVPRMGVFFRRQLRGSLSLLSAMKQRFPVVEELDPAF